MGIDGLAFSEAAPLLIYVPGNFGLAMAYRFIDRHREAADILNPVRRWRSRSGGFFYAVGVQHGQYVRRPSVAATAWSLMSSSEDSFNPLYLGRVAEEGGGREDSQAGLVFLGGSLYNLAAALTDVLVGGWL